MNIAARVRVARTPKPPPEPEHVGAELPKGPKPPLQGGAVVKLPKEEPK